MPIVINEFEVVAEPESSGLPTAVPAPAPPAVSVPDIQRVVLYLAERASRVEAH